MLNIPNYAGLTDAIEAEGYTLHQHDGVVFAVRAADGAHGQDIDSAVDGVVANYPVSAAADVVCAEIEVLANQKRATVLAPWPESERVSWSRKLAEAQAYDASGNAADAPFLSREATRSGITLQGLAAKVLGNAAAMSGYEADMAGASKYHRDAVRALTTHAQIMAYDYSTGWPL